MGDTVEYYGTEWRRDLYPPFTILCAYRDAQARVVKRAKFAALAERMGCGYIELPDRGISCVRG